MANCKSQRFVTFSDETKHCSPFCPKFFQNVTRTMAECLDECPAYNYASECVPSCPTEAAFVYSENKTCASWCEYYTLSSDYQKYCEEECPNYHLAAENNSYQCVYACPSEMAPDSSDTCVVKT